MNSSAILRRTRQIRDAGCSRHRMPVTVSWGSHMASQVMTVTPRTTAEGCVLLAHVPFADGSGFKVRPVIVVGFAGRSIAVRPCTSQVSSHPWLPRLADLDTAGLARGTAVRPEVVLLETSDVLTTLGHLSDDDLRRVTGWNPSHPYDERAGVAA